jgi:hypothetical protein
VTTLKALSLIHHEAIQDLAAYPELKRLLMAARAHRAQLAAIAFHPELLANSRNLTVDATASLRAIDADIAGLELKVAAFETRFGLRPSPPRRV